MNWLKSLVFVVLAITPQYCFSNNSMIFRVDSTTKGSMISANLISGVLMYHHKEMEILREKPVGAIELSWIFHGNGNKLWHQFYHYPEYGLSYVFMDLGSPTILGYSHGLLPFVNFPVTPFNHKLSAGFRVGGGISYITKKYHRTENFKNSAISTHINALVSFNLEGRYNITNDLSARLGFHLTHLSNGTIKKPNAGLNYPMISLGLAYCYKNQKISNENRLKFVDRQNRFQFFGYGSYKEAKGAGGPKYGVGAISMEYSRPIKTLWRYGIALDLMYDESSAFIMEYKEIPYDTKWQTVSSGVTINTEIMLDRLSAVVHFGKYIQNPSREGGALYQRIGLRYRFVNRFWMHLALKTHWGSADYIEFGLGYKIY
jgi:hypothetical protein